MRQVALALILGLAAAGCVNREAQEQAKRTEAQVKDTTVHVSVETISLEDIEEAIEVTGQIAAADESTIGSTVAGKLVLVAVEDGQMVSAGQLIAKIDSRAIQAALLQAEAQRDAAISQLQQAEADAEVGPARSAAAVKASEARLRQAEERLKKLIAGSREEERNQAEAGVRRAKSDLEMYKSNRDRLERLYKEGAVAKADLEIAENQYANALASYETALEQKRLIDAVTRPEDIAAGREDVNAARQQLLADQANQKLDVTYQQRVDAARSSLAAAEQAVSQVRTTLSDHSVYAPFSGRISGRPFKVGTVVSPGLAIARLVAAEGLEFEARVPERDLPHVRVGSLVSVTIDALRDWKGSGTVMAINPLASDVGRQYTVRISINETAVGISPGMFARGRIVLGSVLGAALIPAESILWDDSGAYVFVASGDAAERRSVEPGPTEAGRTRVTGLSEGDQLITAGQSGLVNGAQIKVSGSDDNQGA